LLCLPCSCHRILTGADSELRGAEWNRRPFHCINVFLKLTQYYKSYLKIRQFNQLSSTSSFTNFRSCGPFQAPIECEINCSLCNFQIAVRLIITKL
jgi:hypothetical protein